MFHLQKNYQLQHQKPKHLLWSVSFVCWASFSNSADFVLLTKLKLLFLEFWWSKPIILWLIWLLGTLRLSVQNFSCDNTPDRSKSLFCWRGSYFTPFTVKVLRKLAIPRNVIFAITIAFVKQISVFIHVYVKIS